MENYSNYQPSALNSQSYYNPAAMYANQFGSVLNSNLSLYNQVPAQSFYNPAMMYGNQFGNTLNSNIQSYNQNMFTGLNTQQSYNSRWLNNGWNNGVVNPWMGSTGTNSLPYSIWNGGSVQNTPLDTAVSHYLSAKNAAIQSGGVDAKIQTAITAGINALTSVEDQNAIVTALRSNNVNPNSTIAEMFHDFALVGKPSWMTQLPVTYPTQVQTQLTQLDQNLAAAQTAVTTAQTAVSGASTLNDYQVALQALYGAQSQVSILTAQRANAALAAYQPTYQSPRYFQLPYNNQQVPYNQMPAQMNYWLT